VYTEPLLKVIVPPEAAPVLWQSHVPLTVTAPVKAMVKFAFTVSWLPDAIDMVAHAAFAVTVTVRLPSITALSPATGALAPLAPPDVADHVPVEFQLPLATEYRFAAIAFEPTIATNAPINKNRMKPLRDWVRSGCRKFTRPNCNRTMNRAKIGRGFIMIGGKGILLVVLIDFVNAKSTDSKSADTIDNLTV
jgi:hypothetical protein